MGKYKAVIFDCDGVLVDSETISNKVLVEMSNKLGANINFEFAIANFKGNAMHKCIQIIEGLINKKIPSNFETEFRNKTFKRFREDIKPIRGVVELLENLNVPFCVASSGPIHKIKLNLELTGLLHYFEDRIFSCYTVKKWKPEPDVFLLAANTIGYKPSECLVVEDSAMGVEAALRGGFDVFNLVEPAEDLNYKYGSPTYISNNILDVKTKLM